MKIGPTGAWLDNDPGYHRFDESLARALCAFFKGYSVADIGCGDGHYTMALREAGIVADGWDGNPNTPELTGGMCRVADFSQEQRGIYYDWALCLEVGEHIPAKFEATFIKNLDAANRFGIVISWAIPGQEGMGHVNRRTNNYVRDLFLGMGYCVDGKAKRQLRRAVSDCYWLKKTLMVFRRKDENSGNNHSGLQHGRGS